MLHKIGKLEAMLLTFLSGVYLVFVGVSGLIFHFSEKYYMPVFEEWFALIFVGIVLIFVFYKYDDY